ncbi:MAG TPA: rhombosortase [Steroidobacteraceae bacterium]|nr:rhombosortase [Steroidobacteraceae bacterium]
MSKPVQAHARRPGLARALNADGRHGFALLTGLAVLLAPLAGGAGLRAAWRYDRTAVAAGEWWRLFTAHLVHLDAHHALLNAAGFVLLWALFARSYPPLQWLLGMLICVVVIDAGFWLLSPRLAWYVGASALLHGVFACGCLAWIRRGEPLGLLALAALAAKLIWEHFSGPLPFMGGRPVVTVSHLYGAAGGVAAGLLLRPRHEPLY